MNNIGWNFSYTYKTLPNIMFSERRPTPVKAPELVVLNEALCHELGLNSLYITAAEMSGNQIYDAEPFAQAYAGHQFGHFTILGDGRAIVLGEHTNKDNELFDVQFKGTGTTRYSRSGDGRATLSSMLREYIISEAMHALKIPTTRSLAVVKTGETVARETYQPGGILTRVSRSHIRVGTFQFAAIKGINQVKTLADYSIDRLYPELEHEENKYLKLLYTVINKQASLIAKWQSVGFIHGVMNTDNVSIASETIDYGPCAFMDEYHEQTVFSSIDNYGRYAYQNQPIIAQWNLARFAETLIPLLDADEKIAIELANKAIETFTDTYQSSWLENFSHKIGLKQAPKALIDKLLELMQVHKMDFTNTFSNLSKPSFTDNRLNEFLVSWRKYDIDYDLMRKSNPLVIPRNHIVDKVLKAAEKKDFKPFYELMTILANPFDYSLDLGAYGQLPEEHERVTKTYCGT